MTDTNQTADQETAEKKDCPWADIPSARRWLSVEQIQKGWSDDRKYRIVTDSGETRLLRLSEGSKEAAKRREFEVMRRAAETGIAMSHPLECGLCGGGALFYILLTWMEGEDAERILPGMSGKEQWNFGVRAGRMLAALHTVSVAGDFPAALPDWREEQAAKRRWWQERYETCGVRVPHDREMAAFLDEREPVLSGVKRVFCHGDYHVGNFVISSEGSLAVIDFNRWKYADPYRDFNRMAFFSRGVSVPFACGQIAGYFGPSGPSPGFFDRMAYYVVHDALYGIVWSLSFGEEEVRGCLRRAAMVFDDYDGLSTVIPRWYREYACTEAGGTPEI